MLPGNHSPRDRWYVLGVLTVVYALNIADRFSISTLIEPIRLELQLSDSGIGFLTGVALAIFYVTVGIPIASFADHANRRNIVAVALAVWSGMTAFCGLSQNYWQLLLARFGVGIGEAGGTAPSTSLLADKFPAEKRPMALTIFALGACLGAWLGSSVAGGIAESHGWRAAFLALGIPGLVCALIVWLTVREPPRGALDGKDPTSNRGSLRETLRFLSRQRAAIHLLIGGSVATFWSWGLMRVRVGSLCGVPCRILRVSFTGELSYEINVPADFGAPLWERICAVGQQFGIEPFGVESLLLARIEKGYLHVGADTDGNTVPSDIGFGEVVAKKAGDFVGRRSLTLAENRRPDRLQLIGLRCVGSAEAFSVGAHLLDSKLSHVPKDTAGYLTSACFSPSLKEHIGLGLLRNGRTRLGETVYLFDQGKQSSAVVVGPTHYDPSGTRLDA